MFYKKEGKWTEVPYIQLFFFLKDDPKWLRKCTQTMVTLCKKPSNSLEEPVPKNHLMLHQVHLYPLTQLPCTLNIIPQDPTPSN
jgi:hypothetical protein